VVRGRILKFSSLLWLMVMSDPLDLFL